MQTRPLSKHLFKLKRLSLWLLLSLPIPSHAAQMQAYTDEPGSRLLSSEEDEKEEYPPVAASQHDSSEEVAVAKLSIVEIFKKTHKKSTPRQLELTLSFSGSPSAAEAQRSLEQYVMFVLKRGKGENYLFLQAEAEGVAFAYAFREGHYHYTPFFQGTPMSQEGKHSLLILPRSGAEDDYTLSSLRLRLIPQEDLLTLKVLIRRSGEEHKNEFGILSNALAIGYEEEVPEQLAEEKEGPLMGTAIGYYYPVSRRLDLSGGEGEKISDTDLCSGIKRLEDFTVEKAVEIIEAYAKRGVRTIDFQYNSLFMSGAVDIIDYLDCNDLSDLEELNLQTNQIDTSRYLMPVLKEALGTLLNKNIRVDIRYNPIAELDWDELLKDHCQAETVRENLLWKNEE